MTVTSETPTSPTNLSTASLTASLTSSQSPDIDLDASEIEKINKLKDQKEFVAWALSEYKKAKSARTSIERQWYMNMAFFQGKQWVTYPSGGSGVTRKLMTPNAPPYRVRQTINRVRSVVRTELSRLISNKPNASCVPASSEDEDLFAAQAAEQVWESLYSTQKLPITYRRAAFWVTICGTGFVKTWWDKNATKQGPNGQVYQGDIRYAAVNPFNLFVPDLTEEEIENQPFVINAYTKPVQWAKQAYGEDFSPTVVAANEIIENGFLNLQSAGQNAKPDSCLVLEIWMKPGAHRLFPAGGYVTLVDDRVVSWVPQVFFAHREYPFTKIEHIPSGAFYSTSVIEDIIPVQRELNRTRSQIIEAKNRMAKPQLIAPRGSVDPSKITSEPGQVILYRPGLAPPQPLPLQPLPGYVLQEYDRSLADIEDLTSQHQVSKGTAPAGVTAATAISFLQEKDDSPMAVTYQSVEAAWEKIAKQSLSLVVQFWDTERIVQVTGVDGSFDSIALKGSDIASGIDIRVEAGSALPTSKAARQALLMDLMVQGFIPPEKGLKLMEVGGVNKLYEELAIDERQAQRENLRMRSITIQQIEEHARKVMQAQMMPQGINNMDAINFDQVSGQPVEVPTNIVPVNTWDNHQVHIDVHNRFRKGQAFEQLPDPVKLQFEAHVAQHAMALIGASNNAQMMPPADPGQGDPNAQPPGPDPGQGSNQFDMPPGM